MPLRNTDLKGNYLLCSNSKHSIKNIAYSIRDIIDKEATIEFSRKLDSTRSLIGDSTKFRSETKWLPQVSLEEGLEATISWYEIHS